jgi:DNA processing protein
VDELACWLVLHRAPGLGSRGLAALLRSFPSPCAALDAGHGLLRELGAGRETLAYLERPDLAAVEADLAWAQEPQRWILTAADPRYPPLLRGTADPPQVLFGVGDPDLLAHPQVAVVGSRHPTPGGRDTALAFGRALAQAGLGVTSGLALGIDGAAHRGALAAGGVTLAVAGTGLDRVYPAAHRELAHRLAAEGALVSEFPLGTPPLPENFPRRNRIIAGLALGTVVIEAALRSGSLITARLAAEEGREVFAVPGAVQNPLAHGCHRLIRDGATLVETPEDVLSDIAPLLRSAAPAPPVGRGAAVDRALPPLDPEYRRLLDSMGHDPVSVDTLVQRTGLTADAVSSMLLLLELQGRVFALSGGRYAQNPQGR